MSPSFAILLACGLILAGCARKESRPEPKQDSAPAAEAPSTTVPAPLAFRAIGNEPFWGLFIDAGGLRFTTPDDTAGIRFPPLAPMVMGDTLHWVGVGETERASIDARVWPSRRSDGMSDKTWTHAAVVRIGETTYHGCAETIDSRPDPSGEWVVVAHRVPGISAMTDAEAAKRHGMVVRFGREDAASGTDTCRGVDYRHRTVDAQWLAGEFRVTPADLGLDGAARSPFDVTEVFCEGTKWTAMGATLIWVASDRAYTVWDGVFFELRPAESKGAAGATSP